ncbi:hypothetical protein BS78_01G173900 [Paspalum vaginatum]|nr:hypothetical protein BS78_01G173900 [Paspalum vaginatum]
MIDGFEVVRTLAGDRRKLCVVGFKQRPGVLFHVERSGDAVKCSCRKMEREGLHCRHILCVIDHDGTSLIPDCCALRRLRRLGDTKADRLDEMEELGRQVFDLASEDAKEIKEMEEFFEGWLEDRRRGSGAVAVEDSDDAANAESEDLVKVSDLS